MPKIRNSGRFVLFSTQKNEKKFLLEWIAYHKSVGFTDIIIFSNDCTDGSDLLLDSLAEKGVIQHYIHKPENAAPQMNAERIAREMGLFRNGDWVMWLDVDEYLNVTVGGRKVQTLIKRTTGADAIALNWLVMGDSGVEKFSGRQISNEFTMGSLRRHLVNTQTKTLFQYSDRIEQLEIHRPVVKKSVTEKEFVFKNGAGNAEPGWLHKKLPNGRPFHRIKSKGRYGLGQINHYMVRTRELFEEKKSW